MRKKFLYATALVFAFSSVIFFTLMRNSHPPDAFMAAFTLFIAGMFLTPLVLRIEKESGQQ